MDDYTLDAHTESGIKVLDRAIMILKTASSRPHSLAELCEKTNLPRATTHRLATALEVHQFLARANDGRWAIGPALTKIGSHASDKLIKSAHPLMSHLVEQTGESVQLYRLTGTTRTCIASQEPPSGLQNTVPVGTAMPLTAGSAARIFVAYGGPQLMASVLPYAAFGEKDLNAVRSLGFAESIGEREPGLASVSVPVWGREGVAATLSISGPAERLGPKPSERYAGILIDSARRISEAINNPASQ